MLWPRPQACCGCQGALFLVLDSLALSWRASSSSKAILGESTTARINQSSVAQAMLSFGVVASLLQLSAVFYAGNVPYERISLVLGLCAGINWLLMDATAQGLALSALCAVAAPTSELVVMGLFKLWHYPHPDVLVGPTGIPSWVVFCYFFYTPAVGSLARLVWKSC